MVLPWVGTYVVNGKMVLHHGKVVGCKGVTSSTYCQVLFSLGSRTVIQMVGTTYDEKVNTIIAMVKKCSLR